MDKFSIEARTVGRSVVGALAILLAASTGLLAQVPQANPPPVTVVASKSVGPWTINAFSTGFCVAGRTVPVSSGGVMVSHGLARIANGYRLFVSANEWQLTPGASFPVELDAGPVLRTDTSATAMNPKGIIIELGADRELIRRIAELPSIQIKAAQSVFVLPLDSMQPALAELESCFEARRRALSNPFAPSEAQRPAAAPSEQGARPRQSQAPAASPVVSDGRASPSEPVVASKQEGELVEERSFLTVRNGDTSYRLEALVVRPAKATGRLPIALITHGKDPTAQEMLALRADRMLPQARDLAERGWLAVAVIRRGFGRSDGVPGVARGSAYMSCVNPDLRRAFETEAEDLEGALKAVAERPDADGSRAIAIGVSVGGGTVLAFAARQPKGLRAVINVSGGVQRFKGDGTMCVDEALTSAMTAFGARTTVPTLWLYAENDSLFGPELVRRMREAYAGAGGRVDFHMFPPLQIDGHALFADLQGRIKWLAALDKFLAGHEMPTWNRARVDAVMKAAKLAPGHLKFVSDYFSLPTQKALAVSSNGALAFSHTGARDLAQAREQVLARCREKSGRECTVVMNNLELVAPALASASRQQTIATN